ncbi:Leucine Rich Repeat protein [Aquisphaera giovannonii]|uniref:Leucine Rich Repeat protein n=1 Tax=Aquisphaera giovannonii TaxID=406548 RepID=A0A5B9VVH3_9BACT|nr:hypothetical protein [Aquisphaera giovannonii]QEH32436.1 Leucine Rich Repeat protein [Aquisphaera giovannonii]
MATLKATLPEVTDGRLDLADCGRPVRLPDGLRLRSACLRGCDWLTELPAGLSCYELDLRGTPIRRLPADLRVVFRLDLEGCERLEELPEDFRTGSLVLRGCTGLASLPRGLRANFLDLRGCTALAGWPADLDVRVGRLSLAGCRRITSLPEGIGRLAQLDVSDCVNLTSLPEGLEVASTLELAGSGLTGLPASMAGVNLRWRGVPIDERIAFRPESIAVSEVLEEPNAERRRVLLERVGLERFLAEADADVLDEDTDPGGPRRLLRVPMRGDEDLVAVLVHCPSTGGRYLLRVPPTMRTCRQAIAWTAGFDDPDAYRPQVEA